jgi:hypothetical protein
MSSTRFASHFPCLHIQLCPCQSHLNTSNKQGQPPLSARFLSPASNCSNDDVISGIERPNTGSKGPLKTSRMVNLEPPLPCGSSVKVRTPLKSPRASRRSIPSWGQARTR